MADEDAAKQPEEVKEEQPVEEPQEPTQAEEAPEAPETPEEEPSQPEEEPEPEQPEAPAEEPEAPKPMSRRKAKRLDKLENLLERIKGPESSAQPDKPSEEFNLGDLIDADPEVIENLNKRTADYGAAQRKAGLEEANAIRFHTRLEIDAPRVESKYPIFDPGAAEFNPAVADSINRWYLATVGYDAKTDRVTNPNVRYADFVEGIMELADNMADKKVATTKQNIAKQAATTGLRPDGSSPRMNLGKSPEDMSDAELEAAISATMPRDARGRFTSQSK